jgi:hypothetical protein
VALNADRALGSGILWENRFRRFCIVFSGILWGVGFAGILRRGMSEREKDEKQKAETDAGKNRTRFQHRWEIPWVRIHSAVASSLAQFPQ